MLIKPTCFKRILGQQPFLINIILQTTLFTGLLVTTLPRKKMENLGTLKFRHKKPVI